MNRLDASPGSPPTDPDQQIFDAGIPNVARIYDALLGGKDNYAADRAAALALTAAIPGAARAARDNRAFLARAVRHLAGPAAITQFLDIGTGLPARGHVHEIALAANPDARVAYIDNDPVVIAHGNALLATTPAVAVAQADLRFPRDLMTTPAVRTQINFEQPVAVLLVAVLHFLADSDDPWSIVQCITDHLAPGSYLVISHVTGDQAPADAIEQARSIYSATSVRGTARTRDDIERFFHGLDLIPPGLVDAAWWPSRRRATPRPALFYAGIGRKPGWQDVL
jgi:hypothetical protein